MLQGTLKKAFLVGLLAVVLLVLSACDKKEEWKTSVAEQENAMGRYLETQLLLPEEREPVSELTVSAIRPLENKSGYSQISAELSVENTDTLGQGEEVQARFRENTAPYDSCVPLSCLFYEGPQAYVLAVRQEESALGMEQRLERINVNVLDHNALQAAVEGPLSQENFLFIAGDKPVGEGDRVRLADHTSSPSGRGSVLFQGALSRQYLHGGIHSAPRSFFCFLYGQQRLHFGRWGALRHSARYWGSVDFYSFVPVDWKEPGVASSPELWNVVCHWSRDGGTSSIIMGVTQSVDPLPLVGFFLLGEFIFPLERIFNKLDGG